MAKEIYLDYSATTMPDERVIETFEKVAREYYANPNSNHDAGKRADKIIEDSLKNICDYFKIGTDELIFTSGSSESNNTVLKGVTNEDRNEIITTELEHSSIYGPLSYLQKRGYKVKIVPLNKDGYVDIDKLLSLVNDKTLLVTIDTVNSELGIRQPIEEIGKRLPKDVYFHTDMTQSLGKDKLDLTDVDLASFSGFKIYSFKGIGGLIKKRDVNLVPLISGGQSTTKYRSGTPATELIASMSKAFDLFKDSLDEKYDYVKKLNDKIRNHIKKYPNIIVNSPIDAIPHILNISFLGKSSSSIQKYFNDKKIYISTKTACSSNSPYSRAIYSLTGDMDRAKSSVRISISYKTKEEEIDILLKEIDNLMEDYDEII